MEEAVKQLTDIPAINRFLSYCRVRTVPSKTALIHAGDLPDVLYYIIRGSVEVMIEDEDGNEMVLAYLNKGQFFGEMGLFSDSQQRSAWVRTRTQCELAEMTYPRFRQVASRPHQPQARRPGLRGRYRPDRPRDHGPVRRAGCHDASPRHADQGQPPGAFAPRRLLA
jgi:CRP-like cAMP-binding protein